MTSKTIERMFDKKCNGQTNWVTPNVINFGESGKYIWELSSGEGMSGNIIYGVTFLTKNGDDADDISMGGFQSLEEAQGHISGVA
jgi:hypothetical protein